MKIKVDGKVYIVNITLKRFDVHVNVERGENVGFGFNIATKENIDLNERIIWFIRQYEIQFG